MIDWEMISALLDVILIVLVCVGVYCSYRAWKWEDEE